MSTAPPRFTDRSPHDYDHDLSHPTALPRDNHLSGQDDDGDGYQQDNEYGWYEDEWGEEEEPEVDLCVEPEPLPPSSSAAAADDPTAKVITQFAAQMASAFQNIKTSNVTPSEIKLDIWPSANNLRTWIPRAFEAIRAASNRPIACSKWLEEIADSFLEDLQHPGEFEALDAKMVQWIMNLTRTIGKGHLAQRIRVVHDEYNLTNNYLSGRVLFRTILSELRPDDSDIGFYDIKYLQSVTYDGDVTAFINRWDRIVRHLQTDVGFQFKYSCFYNEFLKIKGIKWIEYKYMQYKDSLSEGQFKTHQEKYEHLYGIINRWLSERQLISNLKGSSAEMMQPDAHKAAPAKGKGKKGKKGTGKGKDKGKGKEKGKTKGKGKQDGKGKGKGKKGKGKSNGYQQDSGPSRVCTQAPSGCPNGHCWDYYAHGSCARQDVGLCTFEHTRPNTPVAPAKATPKSKSKAKPTVLPNSKNQLCGYHAVGRCRKADKCEYMHGANDSRPRAPPAPAAPVHATPKAAANDDQPHNDGNQPKHRKKKRAAPAKIISTTRTSTVPTETTTATATKSSTFREPEFDATIKDIQSKLAKSQNRKIVKSFITWYYYTVNTYRFIIAFVH